MSGFFDPTRPVFVARAPGRLDVMGGIADYSGSLVLEMPIAEATRVTLQETADGRFEVWARPVGGVGETRKWSAPLGDVQRLARVSEEEARHHFRAHPDSSWAAYVVGVWLVLARERGLPLDRGTRVLVQSSVPEGKGVSSSAALEVATMTALAGARELELDGLELALLCQRVENRIVGAPCGIMDQATCALGRKDALLELLCRPAVVRGFRALPRTLAVWGIDSGIRHAVSGSDYGSVRVGAFLGHRMIAELEGYAVRPGLRPGHVRIDDDRFHGHLAEISPEDFDARYRDRLPEHVLGAEFLARYGGTVDEVTTVDPDKRYAVRVPTAHPIHEHARVQRFADLLSGPIEPLTKAALGSLMYASHASYSACGLGSEGTDRLVALVRAAGPSQGLHGAKITGGGSGGTVAVLGDANAAEAVRDVAARYAAETGRRVTVFSGSSPGALGTGALRLPTRPRS